VGAPGAISARILGPRSMLTFGFAEDDQVFQVGRCRGRVGGSVLLGRWCGRRLFSFLVLTHFALERDFGADGHRMDGVLLAVFRLHRRGGGGGAGSASASGGGGSVVVVSGDACGARAVSSHLLNPFAEESGYGDNDGDEGGHDEE